LKEQFTENEIEEIIQDNEELVNERGDSFGVNRDELQKIFENINNFNEVSGFKERIIRKASWILGGITFHQPFNDGNKETALSLTKYFLRKNDLDLPLSTREEEKEIYDLLNKTIFKFEDDPTIISEIEDFLTSKVVVI